MPGPLRLNCAFWAHPGNGGLTADYPGKYRNSTGFQFQLRRVLPQRLTTAEAASTCVGRRKVRPKVSQAPFPRSSPFCAFLRRRKCAEERGSANRTEDEFHAIPADVGCLTEPALPSTALARRRFSPSHPAGEKSFQRNEGVRRHPCPSSHPRPVSRDSPDRRRCAP
jgi:hypothetical protein